MLIFLCDEGVLKVSELAVSIYRFIQYLQKYIHNRRLVSYFRYKEVSHCLLQDTFSPPVECRLTVDIIDIQWINTN